MDIDFLLSTTTLLVVAITLVSCFVPLIILGAVFFFVRRSNKRVQNLLATGIPAQAQILKLWDTGVTVNDNPRVGLLLEVHAPNQPPYQVEIKSTVSRLALPRVQPGSQIPVRIDPNDRNNIVLAF